MREERELTVTEERTESAHDGRKPVPSDEKDLATAEKSRSESHNDNQSIVDGQQTETFETKNNKKEQNTKFKTIQGKMYRPAKICEQISKEYR